MKTPITPESLAEQLRVEQAVEDHRPERLARLKTLFAALEAEQEAAGGPRPVAPEPVPDAREEFYRQARRALGIPDPDQVLPEIEIPFPEAATDDDTDPDRPRRK